MYILNISETSIVEKLKRAIYDFSAINDKYIVFGSK